jgi:nucleoside-diphosphate-sugar epimerase
MKILVTGSQGFTGRYVKDELIKNNHEVLDLEANLLDKKVLDIEIQSKEIDAVMHLAGIAFVQHGNVNAIYENNIIGTRNLLDTLASYAPKVKHVLLASSANVYGNAKVEKITEDTPLDPANDYAISKVAMEYMAQLWMDRLPITITRPFNYTGVGQSEDFVIPKIVRHFKERKDFIELGNIDVWREFNDVRAIANIYQKLIELKAVFGAVNLCSGVTYSLKEIIEMFSLITNHKINIKVNKDLIRKNEVKKLAGDLDKLKSVIGDNKFFDIKETIHWMVNNHI